MITDLFRILRVFKTLLMGVFCDEKTFTNHRLFVTRIHIMGTQARVSEESLRGDISRAARSDKIVK
jgi:hypothetical protein